MYKRNSVENSEKIAAKPKLFESGSDDFNLWLKRFRLYLDVIGVADDKKNTIFLGFLGDQAFRAAEQIIDVKSSKHKNIRT